MVISVSDAQRALKERKKRNAINNAVAHQERVKMHVQPSMSPRYNQPLRDFFGWVETILPADKVKTFKALFRYPLPTNDITGICFDKLSRVFDGRNPAYNYQFVNAEQREDWEYYRQDVLREPAIWRTEGFEYYKTEPNSILVVDMPTENDKSDKYPQPYFYWLRIENVLDYETDERGRLEYLIFKQRGERIAVIDDTSYRVFESKDGNIVGAPVVEAAHNLGYCPATFFIQEPLSMDSQDVKASPISKQLELLDWYLFFHTSKRHLDLYGAYPIYSGYEPNCDYSNAENGDYCDGGFLRDDRGNYKYDSAGLLQKCPRCGDKRIVGVGSFVEVPIPSEGQPDLRNPVQMLTADVDSLKYNVDEETRLKDAIIASVVGVDGDAIGNKSVNEIQVAANFESQTTILYRVKKCFEQAQEFVDATICRLRYGGNFVSAKVNLGTEFYIASASDLRAKYKAAKEAGASESELDALQTQILETEYRTNPTQLQRMLVLAELEPFRHLTRQEVFELHEKGFASDADVRLKLNFADRVRRFERENANVLEFGTALPYNKKIEQIKKTLHNYD